MNKHKQYVIYLYFFCILVSLLPGLPHHVYAQLFYNQRKEFLNANKVWTFGRHAGVDFNTNPPRVFESASNTFLSGASFASPSTGQLQFYSQGNACFNRDHKVMPNGSGLLGNPFNNGQTADGGTSQGVCILPTLEKPGQYYLFSLGSRSSGITTGRLYYSIVDTSLDSGLGDIIPGKKNIMLDENLSESMIGIPGNNCDLWLLVHDRNTAQFKAYHVTYSGIHKTPVISNTGRAGGYAMGTLTISPDRKTLALASNTATILPSNTVSGVQLFRFDAETGIVSDGISLNDKWSFSPCFSPDNRLLYVHYGDTNTSSIRQYDISSYTAATILASEVVIDTFRRNERQVLRLYNDKIYIAQAATALSVINKPNLRGLACDYRKSVIPLLNGTETRAGLPAEAVLPFPQDTIHTTLMDTTICSTTGSQNITYIDLKVRPLTGLYIWDNGSTDSVRRVTKRGRYWVFYKGDCHSYIDSFIVGGSDFSFNLGKDTLLCDAGIFTLSAFVPGASHYLWQDNSTSDYYEVTKSGKYWLSITKENCTLADTIQVNYIDLTQKLGDDLLLCNDVPINLQLQAQIPPQAGTAILWSTGATTPSLNVNDSGTYWVRAQNRHCMATDTIRISQAACSCFMNVPTAFSPNQDGRNDIFLPLIETGCPINFYALSIYNRWGQRIFSSTNPEVGWDGTFKGAPAELGTYFYTVRFEGGIYRTKYEHKGDLTLIR